MEQRRYSSDFQRMNFRSNTTGNAFTEENVKAITYFGKSTSRDDPVKTGRFGVGFKSVFAFTATPIIISGDEHFQIHGLYRVREYPYPNDLQRPRTRIILPFNHEDEFPDYVEDWMPRKEAHSKISARLTGLNMSTLLFTRKIREIRWEIDNRSGHYLREDITKDDTRWTTITDGDQLKKYLVFSRVPRWENQEYKAVEIVFAANEKGQIVSADNFLYVLFATTQETHLRFILNGPYRTNPSRETISENDRFNKHLINETCKLMKEALPQLRERNLLTTQFLSVLPNQNDNLRDFYAPLFETIVETFRGQELVPTDDNQYASAVNVLQGPAAIREVITKEELPFLTGRGGVLWAKGVQQNSPADNFLRSLNITSWGWEQLQNVLEEKYDKDTGSYWFNEEDDAWLTVRTDAWLQKLYLRLADAIRRRECSEQTLKNCRIIRVFEGGIQNHAIGSDAYFMKRGYGNFPHVKRAILQGRNQQEKQRMYDSLVALGVSEIGEEEQIDRLLNVYYSKGGSKVEEEQHLEHINTFIKWIKKTNDVRKFKNHTIFFVDGKDNSCKPAECFLDSPFEDTGLEALFGCSAVRMEKLMQPVSKKYKNVNGFVNFAKDVGVMYQLEIREHKATKMQSDAFPVIGNKTSTTVDRDYFINALKGKGKVYWHNKGSQYYVGVLDLTAQRIEISLAVWKALCHAEEKVLRAFYYPNNKNAHEQKRSSSFLVNQLKSCAWIPDKNGRFHSPADITEESLQSNFPFDNRNGWLDAIGFGESAKKQSAEYKKREEQASSLGIPVEVVHYFAGLPEEEREKECRELIDSFKRKAMRRERAQRIPHESIPYDKALSEAFSKPGKEGSNEDRGNGGLSQNPSRRRKKISEEIDTALKNEGDSEDRSYFSVRKNWEGKNDQVRADFVEWYSGRCQICDWTFARRNGEPYFEGLYIVSRTTADWVDRVGNVLCLCAQHGAMFRFGSKEVDEDIIQQVMRLKTNAEGGDSYPAIRMKLCGKPIEIKFAEKHLIDLQEMIRTAQESGV